MMSLRSRVKERTAELDEAVLDLQKQVEHRIKAEETAKAERQRLNDVLETLPDYVCLLTPDYYMPFANRIFREWFGYEPEKKCYEFLFNRKEPCENCQTYNVLKDQQAPAMGMDRPQRPQLRYLRLPLQRHRRLAALSLKWVSMSLSKNRRKRHCDGSAIFTCFA